LAVVALLGGCIAAGPSKPAEKPKVYVTPCNIAGVGVQVRVNDKLTVENIKPALESAFVDDFQSPAGSYLRETYTLKCYWGNNVDERRDYYYCVGKYKAPDLDENKVIKRFIWKDFKVGFTVEEHNIGSWVDSAGEIHNEGSVYYLVIKTVDGSCYLV
jgi:hypothetical protein